MLAGRQHFVSVGNRLKTDGPGGGSSGIHNRSPAESGLYYLNGRYYDPEARRFVNADDVEILDIQEDLYDKNLFAYCDDNPICRVDEYGNLWELALAGGGMLSAGSGFSIGALAGSILTGLGSITPVGWVIIGTIAVVGVVSIGISYARKKSKDKSKEEVDPYARPGQKKQGRENKKLNSYKKILSQEIIAEMESQQSSNIIHRGKTIKNINI